MHAGQKTVFNSLRQKYWFIGGVMYVKNLVRKLCKKTRCRYIRYMTPRMSPLIRLDNPEAWSNVGVDYLGPIMCKAECGGGGTKPCPNTANVKVWVSLFTCLHSRAIHCEIVRDCSAPAFLLAFRRFVALKNKPNCFIVIMR